MVNSPLIRPYLLGGGGVALGGGTLDSHDHWLSEDPLIRPFIGYIGWLTWICLYKMLGTSLNKISQMVVSLMVIYFGTIRKQNHPKNKSKQWPQGANSDSAVGQMT